MKNLIKLFSIAFLFGAIFMSCEGPEGPAGLDGTDGTDGTDGNVTCLVCHSGTVMEAIQSQFYSSQHALGDIAVDYAGGQGRCAECHSHQGYVEWANTGDVAEDFSAPEAWKCSTCHSLHKTFEATDYAFRAGGAVTLLANATITLDEGNNNTCLNCHQSRTAASAYDKYTVATVVTNQKLANASATDYAFYKAAITAGEIHLGATGAITTDNGVDTLFVKFDIPTTDVYISSAHAGPHHGPQANTWAGVGASAIAAGTTYAPHSAGCVKCHMGSESGHSFKPEGGNCMVAGCHTAVPEAAMDAIAARIQAVGEALEAVHAVHFSDGTFHPVMNVIPRAQFNAFWSFMIVLEDRSNGAHNPTYIKAMLTKCETDLGI